MNNLFLLGKLLNLLVDGILLCLQARVLSNNLLTSFFDTSVHDDLVDLSLEAATKSATSCAAGVDMVSWALPQPFLRLSFR